MKKISLLILSAAFVLTTFGQNATDTNFVTIVSAVNWIPDGKSLLLNIVKFDKTRKVPPVFGGYIFNIESKKLESLGFTGGGRAASPDGKQIAFVKTKENNKGDIYLYDLTTKQESVLVTDTFNKVSPGW